VIGELFLEVVLKPGELPFALLARAPGRREQRERGDGNERERAAVEASRR
jgi:hypothetical protein